MELSSWFVWLNIVTSCFGLVYYFTQARAACKTCSKLHKMFILVCFASSGITMFLSVALTAGLHKYAECFLFFSWFTVVLSAYFLQRPKLARPIRPPQHSKTASAERDSNVIMMPLRRSGEV